MPTFVIDCPFNQLDWLNRIIPKSGSWRLVFALFSNTGNPDTDFSVCRVVSRCFHGKSNGAVTCSDLNSAKLNRMGWVYANGADEGNGAVNGIWYNIHMEAAVEIALASDRNYFRGLAVTACSIAKSADKAVTLCFHLLHIGLTDEDQNWLSLRIRRYHSESDILFHDVSDADMSDFPFYASSKMPYARLLLPRILPSVEYVIYSDVDVLWSADIFGLWESRKSIPMVGCVRELSSGTLKMERQWFSKNGLPFDETRYFCTGISLYNLNEIRRRDAFAAVLEFGRNYRGYNCADQSMMYGALGKEVALLPDKWQTFPRNGVKTKRGEPVVLHYAGEAPWKASRVTKMLTDTQLLWFDMCAEVFGETKWQSLRKFYKAWEIIAYRAVFLMIFRIPPIHALFRAWLRRTGRGPFEESFHAG